MHWSAVCEPRHLGVLHTVNTAMLTRLQRVSVCHSWLSPRPVVCLFIVRAVSTKTFTEAQKLHAFSAMNTLYGFLHQDTDGSGDVHCGSTHHSSYLDLKESTDETQATV